MLAVKLAGEGVQGLAGHRPARERHGELVGLLGVAAVRGPFDRAVRLRHSGAPQHGFGLALELLEPPVEGAEVERIEGAVERVRPVAAEIRRDEPEGGEPARDGGDDHFRDVELLREGRGMDRPGPPERHQAEFARIVSALDGHDAKGLRHAVVDDADDPGRRIHHSLAEGVCDVGANRPFRRRRVDREPSAEEVGAAQEPEHHVRVGHRGAVAALRVAGGAGLRSRACRADPERAARIEPRDAAASRAHLRQIDDRHPDRVAGSVQPAPDVALSPHLVLRGGLDAAVLDEARLRGGAAHVEGDEVRASELVAEPLRGDDSGRGPGLDGGGGHPEGSGDVEDSAVRPHDMERREIELPEGRFQAFEVGGEHGSDVGAHGGRAGAFELADLGEDFARKEDREAGQGGAEPLPDALFVHVVEEGEHEAHGDRLHAVEATERADERIDLGVVEGGDDCSLRVDPLRHLEPLPAGDEHRGGVLEEIVEVRAGGAPDLEKIAEPAGRDQGDVRALGLEEGVGDDGGGVGEEGDRVGRDAVLVHRGAGALDDRRPEIARRRRHLGDPRPSACLVEHRDVRERPPDVDPDPPSHPLVPPSNLAPPRSCRPGLRRRRCFRGRIVLPPPAHGAPPARLLYSG